MRVREPGLSPTTEVSRVRQPSPLPSAERQAVQVRVDVSGRAKILQQAYSPQVVDEARVAAVRQAIDSGAFRIDPEQIAAKILEEGA